MGNNGGLLRGHSHFDGHFSGHSHKGGHFGGHIRKGGQEPTLGHCPKVEPFRRHGFSGEHLDGQSLKSGLNRELQLFSDDEDDLQDRRVSNCFFQKPDFIIYLLCLCVCSLSIYINVR